MARYALDVREKEVLEELRCGSTPRDVAKQRGIALATARVIVTTVRMKFGARSTSHLLELLANGKQTTEIPVSHPEPDPLQRAELDKEAAARFQELLGPEREGVPCRRPGCKHGAIVHSVMCRNHHVEMLSGKAPAKDSDA